MFKHYIQDYQTFIHETMSVLKDKTKSKFGELDVSKIVNKFMEHVQLYPSENFEMFEDIFGELIMIRYKPDLTKREKGETRNKMINIYTPYDSERHSEIKYTLIHELVHVIHQILSNIEKPLNKSDVTGRLRYKLLKDVVDAIDKQGMEWLSFILYMEDKYETLAKCQNAYMLSYDYTINNKNTNNHDVVEHVFDKLKLSQIYFLKATNEIKTHKSSFIYIISILVGHFFELGKSGIQQYFDKDVYNLPVVKEMRKRLKNILNEYELNFDKLLDMTLELIQEYKPKLEEYRYEITDSFIKYMEIWYKEVKRKLTKAITLGIEDAKE